MRCGGASRCSIWRCRSRRIGGCRLKWAVGNSIPGLSVNLLPLVDDADVQVRATACWAAGVVGLAKTVPSLVANLGHGFAPVRRESARALGRLHAVSALDVLAKMAVEDFDPLVRARADESAKSLRAK